MRSHKFLLIAALLSLSAGCRHVAPVAVATHNWGTSRKTEPSATVDMRLSPAYKQAVSSYKRRDYADSLARLNALAGAPERTPEEKVFLARQLALCRSALGQKSTAPVAVTAARSASPVSSDCGPRALAILCRDVFHIPASLPDLCRTAGTTRQGTSLAGMEKAARSCGLHAEGVQMDKDALARLSSPAIAWVGGNHYIAVLGVHDDPWTGTAMATIHDPNHDGKEEMAQSDLLRRSGGILLTVSPLKTLAKGR